MQLLVNGTNQEASAKDYEIIDLASMVECAVEGKTMLYVCDSEELDVDEKSIISRQGKEHVIFK